jgi:hypothetical protein
MKVGFSLGVILALLLVAGCGGSTELGSSLAGAPGAPGAPSTTPPDSPATAQLVFQVQIPPGSGLQIRRPSFVGASGAQSASFLLLTVNGKAVTGAMPIVAALNASNHACTLSSGQLSCAIALAAPAGTLTYLVSFFASSNGSGSSIGEGTVQVVAQSGQTVTVSTTLGGTVAKIAIELAGTVELGVSGSVNVIVNALDANGVTIVGNYSTPISLSDTDASGQTSLSSTVPLSSSTAANGLTLSYAGGAMAGGAMISATAAGIASANITPATFLPDATAPTVNGASTTFAFSSVETQNIPSGGPSGPFTSSGTFTVDIATGQTFNGVNNLVSMTGLLVPTAGSPTVLSTSSQGVLASNFTAYFAWTPAGNATTLGYVGLSSSKTSVTTSEVCAPPYSQQIVLPFPSSWNVLSGSGACTLTIDKDFEVGDTQNETATFNADGTYSDVGTNDFSANDLGTGSFNQTSQPNGSAVITQDNTQLSFILTIPTPSPDAAKITTTIQVFQESIPPPGTSTPTPHPVTVANPWAVPAAAIPGGSIPSPLQSDIFSLGNATTLPVQCAVPSAILGTSPSISEAVETIVAADPMQDLTDAFYSSSTITHYYLDGVGEVCTGDTENQAEYDLNALEYYADCDPVVVTVHTTTWTYVTTTSLMATAKRVRNFAQALPATTQAFSAASYALIRAGLQSSHARRKALTYLRPRLRGAMIP